MVLWFCSLAFIDATRYFVNDFAFLSEIWLKMTKNVFYTRIKTAFFFLCSFFCCL